MVQPGTVRSWLATVAPNGDGRLALAVAAGQQLVQSASQTAWSNGWSGWAALPPVPQAQPGLGFFAPGVAANADGRLELFVANGALWRSQQTAWSNGWSGWQAHGAPNGAMVLGPVTAGRSGDGRIEVFVIDQHGQMWNIRQSSANGSYTGWNAFGSPGATLDDRPGLARSADGRLELFIRGTDGHLYHQRETGVGTFAWSGWDTFDAGSTPAGGLIDHPVVGPGADGRLELFLTGADGNIYHAWQTQASNGWSAWVSEGSARRRLRQLRGRRSRARPQRRWAARALRRRPRREPLPQMADVRRQRLVAMGGARTAGAAAAHHNRPGRRG